MRRPTQNFAVDVAVFVLFIALVATGFLMKYALPPGSGRAATMLALNRHEWGDIHFWIAVAMIALIAVHLLLHTKWIVAMVQGKNPLRRRRRAVLGTIAAVAVLALVALPFLLPVERSSGGDQSDHGTSEVHATPDAADHLDGAGERQGLRMQGPRD
jgi:amino acid transporter